MPKQPREERVPPLMASERIMYFGMHKLAFLVTNFI
jgi:hypothetical protein